MRPPGHRPIEHGDLGPTAPEAWEPATDLEPVRPEWSTLAERSGNLFSTWEWTDAWWRHLGRGQLSVVMCRHRGGEAMALLPLYRAAGRLQLLGSGASDELGPISAPKDQTAAAEALGRFLRTAPFPWDAFVGDDMPGDMAWDRLLGGRITRQLASPTLRAAGMSWQDFLNTRSANFREQVRGRERRMWQDHNVVLYETEDPTRLERDLETLFELHVARWGWARAEKFAGAQQRAFLHEFAATALRQGWLRLRVLELDGRPVAAMLNFRFGGSEWFYQGGRDPGVGRYSVGFVLQAHAVREALNDGMRSYRFLRGEEAYKQRFTNADNGVVTIRVDNIPDLGLPNGAQAETPEASGTVRPD